MTERTQPNSTASRRNAFLDGLSCGFRALLEKELRSGSRGWRFTLMLTGYLCALAAFVAGFLALSRLSSTGASPLIGLRLFAVLAFGTVLLLTIITVAVTSSAISGERERRTLDLLLVTRASALGLVTGKLAGALVHILFLLIASLPAFAMVYLFGGVPVVYLVLFFVVACTTAAFYASLGLLFSAWLRRTVIASVLSFVVMLALVAGVPITAGVLRQSQPDEQNPMRGISRSQGWSSHAPFMFEAMRAAGPPTTFAYSSPLVALASVLPTSSDDEFSMVGPMLQLFTTGSMRTGDSGISLFRAIYIDRVDRATGVPVINATWAPWLFFVLLNSVAVPIALFLASLALSPSRGGRRRGRARAS